MLMLRRTFIQVTAWGAQGIIALVAAVPGLRALLDPLRRSSTSRPFIRVAPLAALSGGTPIRATVEADRWDAFTHYPPGPIGSVWLLLVKPGDDNPPSGDDTPPSGGDHAHSDDHADAADRSSPRVLVWQTICPHLGCGIDYSPERQSFNCPCHASDFDLTGKCLEGPSPREMDQLENRVTDPDENGQRWVEVAYQAFQTGTPEKRPMT